MTLIFKQEIYYKPEIQIIPNNTTKIDFAENWNEFFRDLKNLRNLYVQKKINDVDWILINKIKPKFPEILEDPLLKKILIGLYGLKGYEKYKGDILNWLNCCIGIKKGKRTINKDWEDFYVKNVHDRFYNILKPLFILIEEPSKQSNEIWDDLLIYIYNYPNEFRNWYMQLKDGIIPFPIKVRAEKIKIEETPKPYIPEKPPIIEPEKPKIEPMKAEINLTKFLPLIAATMAIYLIIKK